MARKNEPEKVLALSNGLRAKILAILAEQAFSPKEMAEETGESVGAVSYHVRILHECRVIELEPDEPRGGADEHRYRLSDRQAESRKRRRR
jgi:DNA-binding transcriptional ArsR family regulator